MLLSLVLSLPAKLHVISRSVLLTHLCRSCQNDLRSFPSPPPFPPPFFCFSAVCRALPSVVILVSIVSLSTLAASFSCPRTLFFCLLGYYRFLFLLSICWRCTFEKGNKRSLVCSMQISLVTLSLFMLCLPLRPVAPASSVSSVTFTPPWLLPAAPDAVAAYEAQRARILHLTSNPPLGE